MRPRSLLSDSRGITVVEFAIIAPVFLVMLLGVFDLGHNMYTTSMMQGAIQKVARDSTIEGAASSETALEDRMKAAVHRIAPQADVEVTWKAYTNFSDVKRGEDFTDSQPDPDTPPNGICDNGEPFVDVNGNGTWEDDLGSTGFGSARDATLLTVRAEYERFFPVAEFIGQSRIMVLEVETVLRNQPYGLQNMPPPPVNGNCT